MSREQQNNQRNGEQRGQRPNQPSVKTVGGDQRGAQDRRPQGGVVPVAASEARARRRSGLGKSPINRELIPEYTVVGSISENSNTGEAQGSRTEKKLMEQIDHVVGWLVVRTVIFMLPLYFGYSNIDNLINGIGDGYDSVETWISHQLELSQEDLEDLLNGSEKQEPVVIQSPPVTPPPAEVTRPQVTPDVDENAWESFKTTAGDAAHDVNDSVLDPIYQEVIKPAPGFLYEDVLKPSPGLIRDAYREFSNASADTVRTPDGQRKTEHRSASAIISWILSHGILGYSLDAGVRTATKGRFSPFRFAVNLPTRILDFLLEPFGLYRPERRAVREERRRRRGGEDSE